MRAFPHLWWRGVPSLQWDISGSDRRCLNTHDSLLLMGLHSCSTTLSSTGPQSNETRRGRLDAQNNVLLGTLLSSVAHREHPFIQTIIPDGSSSRIIRPTWFTEGKPTQYETGGLCKPVNSCLAPRDWQVFMFCVHILLCRCVRTLLCLLV